MTYLLKVKTSFDAGHRLLGYGGKCASPHGHTYEVELQLVGTDVDDLGMVMDFSDLKGALRDWISENWDHSFLVNSDDIALLEALRAIAEGRIFIFDHENPTAENLAKTLFFTMKAKFGSTVYAVEIRETSRQSVVFRGQH
jgi:6-pyruvoyltetrahydropterin/6-carboxytetrahydropterin synthase